MRSLYRVPKRWLVKRRWLVVLEATGIYKDLWAATIGEVLVCSREPAHVADRKKIRCKIILV